MRQLMRPASVGKKPKKGSVTHFPSYGEGGSRNMDCWKRIIQFLELPCRIFPGAFGHRMCCSQLAADANYLLIHHPNHMARTFVSAQTSRGKLEPGIMFLALNSPGFCREAMLHLHHCDQQTNHKMHGFLSSFSRPILNVPGS